MIGKKQEHLVKRKKGGGRGFCRLGTKGDDERISFPYNRTGGPSKNGPFLLCSYAETKEKERRLKGRGVHHRTGERGVGPVSMGPGRTQAGSSSGEGGTLPGPRPGHSIDIPDTGFPVMYG